MKKLLLLGVSAMMAAHLGAAPLQDQPQAMKSVGTGLEAHVKAGATVSGSRKISPAVDMSTATANGRSIKRIDARIGGARIKPLLSSGATRKMSPAPLMEGMSLYESFEGWDGETLPWYPEGWTVDSRSGQAGDAMTTWSPSGVSPMLPPPSDGEVMMGVNYSPDPLDEWLISPELTIKENEQLKFFAYIDPIFLFNLNNVDWEAMEWIGERQISATLKVLVKEENADWVEVWDASTKWLETSLMDLFSATPSAMEEFTIALSSFEGKKVNIAFQYVGIDGNTILIDAVSVGLPQLDGVVYGNPAETLYWGFDRSNGWRHLNLEIAQYPVYSPVTWTNETYIDGANFSWEYCDPITAEWTASDEEELTVTYVPDYRSESSTRNNWFYAPRLHASAPGAAPSTYQAPYYCFQAGGKPERLIKIDESTTELIDFGLVPFDTTNDGIGIVTMEADFGEASTPIFGYDKNTDQWWLNYTYNGDLEDASESDHVYVEAIMNRLIVGNAPMVITGANLLAKGQITDAAEFRLEIIQLDDSDQPMIDTPVATAICKGENVVITEGGIQNSLNIIFDFDQPVVINPGDNDYMIRFSGFHDPENVTYFVPYQSIYPFTHMYVIGWLDKLLKIQGAEEYRRSYTPMFYHETEFGMCHNAFAINLSAYHPWLEAEQDEIEIPQDGTPVEIALDSYHDGSMLTVETPAGVEANVTGRYGDCKLVVSHNDAEVIAEGNLTVSGPGVKKVFTVSETAGIDGITVDKTTGVIPVAAFTVTGQPVALKDAGKGVYVVKYSDGSASKIAIK